MTPPTTTGIIETVLYVQDVSRSAAFYKDLFGFEEETRGDLICVLRVPGRLGQGRTQALILFARAIADAPVGSPPFATEGTIPSHGGNGRMHVAFSIDPDELQPWRDRLRAKNIPADNTVHWNRGGQSLYFRDPDEHLIELITPGLWSFY